MVQVTLPEMGESVTEGSIVEWLRKVGDPVNEGDPLVSVTTDKVDVEVPSTASGTIAEILVPEGATVAVGAPLVSLRLGNGASPSAATAKAAPSPEPAGAAEPVTIVLPEMGESVIEGSIVEWLRKPGDLVNEGDPLVRVTTDKVDAEVPSNVSGVVTELLASEGATVAVGAPLARVRPAQTAPAAAAKPASQKPAPAPQPVPQPTLPARSGEIFSTAQARRVARKAKIDLSGVRGSGPNGLILRSDVLGYRRSDGTPAIAVPKGAKLTPLKGPAAALIGYMEQSLTIPTATSFRTLSVDSMDTRRKQLNSALKSAGRSEKISFTHLIAFALVRGAHEMPVITNSFGRENGVPVRVEPGIHLGLAVDSERKDGSRFLIVPVIKNADALDFAAFRATYDDLVTKARENKLVADDLQGASFTLTNPGGIGTVASVPRLMAGQGAIVAAGAIAYPPGFAGADEQALRALGVGKIMQMTSTYDHRVIQGAQSGEYLKRVDELLQGKDGFYEVVFASLGIAMPAPALDAGVAPPAQRPSAEMLRAVAAGMGIVAAYRTHGHLSADLDPLGTAPVGDPSLEPATWGLSPQAQAEVPAAVLQVKVPGRTLAEVLPQLRETYSSTIAYEVEHISNTAQREWLRDWIESGRHKVALSNERKIELLARLTRVEVFERYLRKAFLGQKTFSGEGLDIMVPMLEEVLQMLAADGVGHAVVGMAHRGRLSTIAHVVNVPYEEILTEFEAQNQRSAVGTEDVTGDVKYHHGATGAYEAQSGRIDVTLVNNPSHLEAVDPVVEGTARALQTDYSQSMPSWDVKKAAPILIHGDAAFTGQGIVSEVFNLQSLPGYMTGGTLHIIANNQIGFTTETKDARSTRYASDLAKGFDVPIVHVNADDVEACIWAVHLAMEFRRQFGRDVLIDAIGYRRFGHNEADEPAYTQPEMYERIKTHPTARELFAKTLVAQGVISGEKALAMVDVATERLKSAHKAVKSAAHGIDGILAKLVAPQPEAVPLPRPDRAALIAWSDALVRLPDGVAINKKLQAQFERRRSVIAEKGLVDWGMAEALAFASLLQSGVPIRLSGQDTERGTYSHRHAVWHDPQHLTQYVPLAHLVGNRASFEVHNSPLSEYACLGFEYGYSVAAPKSLTLWEAQYGDFFNGAQIVVDQFIAAGQAKWGQTSRLTMLLPHGYEGSGPEHSSARLERFLQLAAEGNLRVANPSNAGNYFHLLRMQATNPQAVPLVVMTPKSLLRMEAAYGTLDEMASGVFAPVIDDPHVSDRGRVERLILCTGKIYYDLTLHPAYKEVPKTAIVRVELLSPLPYVEINNAIASYPNLKTLIWVQEEPKNMGARAHVRRRLLEHRSDGLDIAYVGRPYRASPSEGYPGAHAAEQERIVTTALAE